jgi:hypothetical protein
MIAPRDTWSAWHAPGSPRSLFVTGVDYDGLLAMTIGELRDRLGLPRGGLVGPRRLHGFAPANARA